MSDRLRQWTNDAGTVLVEAWDDGAVVIKERPDRHATWGPPRTLRPTRAGGITLDETDRTVAGAGLHALLSMWASARESFGEMVPDLAHGDRIRELADRLAANA